MPLSLRGHALIHHVVMTAPSSPGVYRFLDGRGKVLYVGKARDLKKRLVSYARPQGHVIRIARMIHLVRDVVIVTTRTEIEALLLESNLIKTLRPRYNILLRDDKSFPFILIREDHPWPLLTRHRGRQMEKGSYYGPFATPGAVRTTINALERIFLLRTCSDSVFANRSRPCLLYQIKRCCAPCVGKVTPGAYADLVHEAKKFLSGRSREVQDNMVRNMEKASAAQQYEQASVYRDRLRAMARILVSQDINIDNLGDADVFALCRRGGESCIQVVFFRGGRHYGDKSYFPRHDADESSADILAAFLPQFYHDRRPPRRIYLSEPPTQQQWIKKALESKVAHRVVMTVPKRGRGVRSLRHARDNADRMLAQRSARPSAQKQVIHDLVEVFGLPRPCRRIEVYDNSHTGGTLPLGVMIVAGEEGFMHGHYRRFYIRQTKIEDDYAILRDVLRRRFRRSSPRSLPWPTPSSRHPSKMPSGSETSPNPEIASGAETSPRAEIAAGAETSPSPETSSKKTAGDIPRPDLVLIDGGKGHLTVAVETLSQSGFGDIPVIAIAKGENRRRSIETLYTWNGQKLRFDERSNMLYFLRRLRDEAHRFAIGSHRRRRLQSVSASRIDAIEGIGAARKRSMLRYFGSAADIAEAGVEDLCKVPGIARHVAEKVHAHFHSSIANSKKPH